MKNLDSKTIKEFYDYLNSNDSKDLYKTTGEIGMFYIYNKEFRNYINLFKSQDYNMKKAAELYKDEANYKNLSINDIHQVIFYLQRVERFFDGAMMIALKSGAYHELIKRYMKILEE